jgi:outer membrane protein assembly factor BamB
LGIDIKTGELLWAHKQDSEGDVHVNTPLFENGFLYYVTGDGNGSVKLELSADGTQIKEVWRNKQCDNTMGGFIKKGDYIYTSGFEKRCYYALNTATGQVMDSLKFDRGITIFADNNLYLYNERGKVALCSFKDDKITKISEFKVTLGTKAHYAHPVICKGLLYIRRGESLMAYDIRKK